MAHRARRACDAVFKKETEAGTRRGQARGEGEEAKPHAGCSSSGRRRGWGVEELEREPGLGRRSQGGL